MKIYNSIKKKITYFGLSTVEIKRSAVVKLSNLLKGVLDYNSPRLTGKPKFTMMNMAIPCLRNQRVEIIERVS